MTLDYRTLLIPCLGLWHILELFMDSKIIFWCAQGIQAQAYSLLIYNKTHEYKLIASCTKAFQPRWASMLEGTKNKESLFSNYLYPSVPMTRWCIKPWDCAVVMNKEQKNSSINTKANSYEGSTINRWEIEEPLTRS
jgi:hypothetical protein